MMNRVHADERIATADEQSVDDPAERALTRRAAIGGTVLLRNETGRRTRRCCRSTRRPCASIAVIGPNAVTNQCMGGGSASLTPFDHRTLLAARHRPARPGFGDRRHRHVRARRAHRSAHPGRPRRPAPSAERRTRTAARVHQRHVRGTATSWSRTSSPSSLVRFFGSIPAGVDPRAFAVRVDRRVHPRHRRHAPGRRRVDRSGRSSPRATGRRP